MAKNKGKQFENVIRKSFKKVPNVSIDRIPDQVTKFKGSKNICDFIVYKKPYLYYLECKSVRGNRLPFSNIKDYQWEGLLEKSEIEGVFAGVICWWIDLDKTYFIPIQKLAAYKYGWKVKSVKLTTQTSWDMVELKGKKKRIYYDYDMKDFLEEMEKNYG